MYKGISREELDDRDYDEVMFDLEMLGIEAKVRKQKHEAQRRRGGIK